MITKMSIQTSMKINIITLQNLIIFKNPSHVISEREANQKQHEIFEVFLYFPLGHNLEELIEICGFRSLAIKINRQPSNVRPNVHLVKEMSDKVHLVVHFTNISYFFPLC